MLKLTHVSYQHILNDIEATLPEHQITTLIGPNGAGKSTLLGLLTAELTPTTGEISGRPPRIALLAQENELFEPLTVRELLTIHEPTLDDDIVMRLNLAPILDQTMQTLSGGQRQMAWLGFVLQQSPDLLLLDEPTTFLDLQFQQRFLKTLVDLQAKRQFTVLMVLHDLTQAFQYSQNIWLLDGTGHLTTGATHEFTSAEQLSKAFNTELIMTDVAGRRIITTA